jgi:hypothetical protein
MLQSRFAEVCRQHYRERLPSKRQPSYGVRAGIFVFQNLLNIPFFPVGESIHAPE